MDDNTQRKDDQKDPRVIAKLVIEGRYCIPYRPKGVYEEPAEPEGAYINGRWVDVEDLPMGYGHSPDWWDDDGFGETFEEYMEHTD